MFEMTENDRNLETLFNELVPRAGKSSSLAGELVRATGRIGYRWSNDGDHIGIGYGNETCNMAARFLIRYGNPQIRNYVLTLWGLADNNTYGKIFDLLAGAVTDYVKSNPKLRCIPTEDMFDYFDESIDIEKDDE